MAKVTLCKAEGICGRVFEVEVEGRVVKIECPVGRVIPTLGTITIGEAACVEKRLADPEQREQLVRVAAAKSN